MNWADLNPVKRKAKPTGEAVYLSVTLDKPFQGITLAAPRKPWIRVSGIGLEAAAQEIPGKSINWHTVPMGLRGKLELDSQTLELEWDELKGWLV